MNIKIGDIVTRPSYQRDLLFRVIAINDSEAGKYATLIGEDVRLIADAPCTDLEVVDAKEQDQRKKQEEERKQNKMRTNNPQ